MSVKSKLSTAFNVLMGQKGDYAMERGLSAALNGGAGAVLGVVAVAGAIAGSAILPIVGAVVPVMAASSAVEARRASKAVKKHDQQQATP